MREDADVCLLEVVVWVSEEIIGKKKSLLNLKSNTNMYSTVLPCIENGLLGCIKNMHTIIKCMENIPYQPQYSSPKIVNLPNFPTVYYFFADI